MEEFNYDESVSKVRTLFITWKTISLELLWELHSIKRILVAERTAGRPKEGNKSWAEFVEESIESVGGPARKTIDSYLSRFEKWLLETGGKGAEEDFRAWAEDKSKIITAEKAADKIEREKKQKKKKEDNAIPIVVGSDQSKLLIKNVVRHGKKMTFDIFLPEFNKTYTKTIYLEGSSATWPM